MRNDLTNLLPSERRGALTREYFLRLGVVGLVMASLLVVAAMILLLPTYLFLTDNARTKEAHLAAVTSALASTDQAALIARLSALSGNAAILSALAKAPSASGYLRSVLALSRPGITLSDFAYAPAGGMSAGTLAVSGTAATRDALRSYQLALESAPFVRSADLPVSAYARDSNISFTITITLAP